MPYFRAGVLLPGTLCWPAVNIEAILGAETCQSDESFEFQPYCIHPIPFNLGLTVLHGAVLRSDDNHIPAQEQRLPPGDYRPGEPVHDMAPGPPESVFMRWSTSALPNKGRRYAAVAALGDRAFFSWGSDVQIYEGTTGAWSEAHLSVERRYMAAATAGTRVLFAGGWVDVNRPVDVVDIYDGETNAWTTAAMSVPRAAFAAAAVGSKIIFAGGAPGNDAGTVVGASAVVDIYDSQTGTWATTKPLSQARGHLAAATLGTRAFFAGGWTGNAYSDVVDIFDSETGLWSTANLSQARGRLAGTTVGNSILFAGGVTDGNIYSDVVDIYDGVAWRTAKLSEARADLAATSLHDKALFAGGHVYSNAPSDRVDIYESATMGGVWSSTSLAEPRMDVRAATIGDKALFAGGDGRGISSVMDIAEQKEFIWGTSAPSWIPPSPKP